MSKTDRPTLKGKFRTGSRPIQADFEDLIDSLVNFSEDGITLNPVNKNVGIGNLDPKEKLHVSGAIVVGSSTGAAPVDGTIKFDSTFQGFKGGTWINLEGGGGGDSFWAKPVPAQDNIAYQANGVGMGINLNATNASLLFTGKRPGTIAPREFTITLDGNSNQLQFKGNSFMFMGTDDAAFVNISTVGNTIEIGTRAGSLISCAGSKVTITDLEVTDNFVSPSDIRLKKNITPFISGLDVIDQLNPVKFSYTGEADTTQGKSHIGLIAQELLQVLPELVEARQKKLHKEDTDTTELLGIKPLELIYLAINGIKELQNKVKQLEKRIELLEV